MSSGAAALKEYYHGQIVTDLVFRKNAFFAAVKKNTKAVGEVIPIPVQYGVSAGGGSATFSSAQANQSATPLAKFMLTRVTDYAVATIAHELWLAAGDDVGAFVKASKLFVDSAYKTSTLAIAAKLYRDRTATLASGVHASGVITMTNKADCNLFEVGMAINAYTDAVGTALSGGGIGYVVAIDISAGTVSISGTAGGTIVAPANWTGTTYYLARNGDGGTGNLGMAGLSAWLPITVASTDSFLGVNRSYNRSRLAGMYVDGSLLSIEETVVQLSSRIAEQGGSPSHCFLNHRSYEALRQSLGTKVEYVDVETEAGVGFRGVRINGDDGEINVIPDRSCPAKTAFMLDMDTWCLYSLGDVPRILTYGGSDETLRVVNADAMELRVGAYLNLGCTAPGWNERAALGA